MNNTERLALIGSRVQAARLRRAIRYMAIDDMVAINGGIVVRPKSRLIRFEVDGAIVKYFQGKMCIDKMLVYLELETAAQQTENRERVAEAIADMKAEESAA